MPADPQTPPAGDNPPAEFKLPPVLGNLHQRCYPSALNGSPSCCTWVLGLFLADAVVSLMDDLLMLFLQLHALTGFRVLVNLLTTLSSIVIYVLMALTPIIPKRLFVPLALFSLLAFLAGLPFVIYYYQQMQRIAWIISFLQLLFGLWVLCRLQGGLKFNWVVGPGNGCPSGVLAGQI